MGGKESARRRKGLTCPNTRLSASLLTHSLTSRPPHSLTRSLCGRPPNTLAHFPASPLSHPLTRSFSLTLPLMHNVSSLKRWLWRVCYALRCENAVTPSFSPNLPPLLPSRPRLPAFLALPLSLCHSPFPFSLAHNHTSESRRAEPRRAEPSRAAPRRARGGGGMAIDGCRCSSQPRGFSGPLVNPPDSITSVLEIRVYVEGCICRKGGEGRVGGGGLGNSGPSHTPHPTPFG